METEENERTQNLFLPKDGSYLYFVRVKRLTVCNRISGHLIFEQNIIYFR